MPQPARLAGKFSEVTEPRSLSRIRQLATAASTYAITFTQKKIPRYKALRKGQEWYISTVAI